MTKKTARTHSKKNIASNKSQKPLFTFTWMLIVFLLLFILTGIVIGINTTKRKTALMVLSQIEADKNAKALNKEMTWQEYRDAAISDVKKTLNQPIKTVKLISFEKVEWPDSSLGCPKSGNVYAQVITPGYKLKLLIDGREYTYHAGSNYVITCNR